jgi:hypothetical protein
LRLRIGEDNFCAANNGATLVIGRTHNGPGSNLGVQTILRPAEDEKSKDQNPERLPFHEPSFLCELICKTETIFR